MAISTSYPIAVVIKVKSLNEVENAIKKINEIKKANPQVVIKPSIEIDLNN